MSILDVRKCKNSDITSILEKKCVDDPKDTANSPSFFLKVNYAESVYVSVISHEVWTLIDSFSVRKSFVP